MYLLEGNLVISKEDIKSFCKDCGSCCRDLTLEDKIDLVRHFGNSGRFLKEKCPFSSKYGCIKYKERPQVCRKWRCGVVEFLESMFNTSTEQKA